VFHVELQASEEDSVNPRGDKEQTIGGGRFT